MKRWSDRSRCCASALVLLPLLGAAVVGGETLDETFPDGVRVRCEVGARADGSRIMNGPYCQWDAGGKKVCIGEYRSGERHGKWQIKLEGAEWETGAYANGFRDGPWKPSASRLPGKKRVFDKYAVTAQVDDRGGKSAEGCLLDGIPHDAWVLYREDGSRLLEGAYQRGIPEGVWLAYLPDGRVDPLLITGVYHDGRRVADVAPWEPRIRFGAAAATRAPAPLPAASDPAIESAVATIFAIETSAQAAQEAVVHARTPRAMPHVLNALCALDLSTEDGRVKADVAEELLLKPVFAGFDLPCGGITRGASEEAVRLAVLRWRTMWEVAGKEPMRLLLDVPLAKAMRVCAGDSALTMIAPPFAAPPGGLYATRLGARDKAHDEAVAAGLDWLARHQDDDGRVSCSEFSARCKPNHCDGKGKIYDVGVTALAALAFLGDHNAERRAAYGEPLARALRFLMETQDPRTGVIQSSNKQYRSDEENLETGLALMALSEAAALYHSDVCRAAVERGVRYLQQTRKPGKAWGNENPAAGENNMTVTGFCVLGLAAAREAGVQVDPEAFNGARLFIDEMTDGDSWRTGWTQRGGSSSRLLSLAEKWPPDKTEAMTALAMVCRVLMGEDPAQSKALRGGADLLRKRLPLWSVEDGTIDYFYWMFGAHAMWQMGGEEWDRWNKELLAAVIKMQQQHNCEKGSWDPRYDPWGEPGGRAYATAALVLALEASGRYARAGS
ncbi:MAG: hypothetical protein HY812_02165 [Planctomycetes bacterium]|nr:hypothetical protein [Planctomycetota bacterium]